MNIRKMDSEEKIECLEIAKGLPEYFNENGLKEIENDLSVFLTYIFLNNEILGYVCIEEVSDRVVEIKQFAVKKSERRNGIGSELLNFVENQVAKGRNIEVKTLDSSCDYEPYESTRAFYEKNGFKKIDVIDPYPGWDPGNPCAVYIKNF